MVLPIQETERLAGMVSSQLYCYYMEVLLEKTLRKKSKTMKSTCRRILAFKDFLFMTKNLVREQ